VTRKLSLSLCVSCTHFNHISKIFDFNAIICYELKVSGLYNAYYYHLGTQVIASSIAVLDDPTYGDYLGHWRLVHHISKIFDFSAATFIYELNVSGAS
jgi:hypothetical protein